MCTVHRACVDVNALHRAMQSILHHASRSCHLCIPRSPLHLQFDALLMFKLPPRAIHSPKAKLVPIQLKLDMWAIQHRHTAVPTRRSSSSRHGKNEHRALLRQHLHAMHAKQSSMSAPIDYYPTRRTFKFIITRHDFERILRLLHHNPRLAN